MAFSIYLTIDQKKFFNNLSSMRWKLNVLWSFGCLFKSRVRIPSACKLGPVLLYDVKLCSSFWLAENASQWATRHPILGNELVASSASNHFNAKFTATVSLSGPQETYGTLNVLSLTIFYGCTIQHYMIFIIKSWCCSSKPLKTLPGTKSKLLKP